jgi:hypothetical protein
MSGYVIEGATGPWELVVGLEVHAQVVSQAKLFSGASASIACITKRTELTFLISQRVRNGSPAFRTDTFTSARIEPSSMFPSQVPR